MQLQQLTIFTVLFPILIQENTGFFLFEKTNITTPNIVKEAGYPLEEHQVTTKDGYILTLHRIPYSPRRENRTNGQPLPIVFMVHGFTSSSTDWVLTGPSVGLGYLFSDNGYDVWMVNHRGNRYSEKHIEKDSSSSEFWNFSWHELGVYDLPASFDYITNETGVDRLTYIGHSQGGSVFFVYCSIDPSCKERIISAHLMGPVVFTKNWRIPEFTILAPILGQPDIFVKFFGSFNPVPNTELIYLFAQLFCKDYSNLKFLCSNFIYISTGPSNYFNESILPYLAGVLPAGASLKQLLHFLQEYNSGKFRQFDYGPLINLWTYGRFTPPDYNLTNVFAPTYMYYSENDFLVATIDVFHAVSLLPEGVLRGLYKVPEEKWNHLDFLYGRNVKAFVYDEVLKNVRERERE